MIILAQIYQCRGDYARSAERYREALALAEALGEPQLLFPCYDGLATLAIEEERRGGGRAMAGAQPCGAGGRRVVERQFSRVAVSLLTMASGG